MMPLRSLRIHPWAARLLVLPVVATLAAGCGSSKAAHPPASSTTTSAPGASTTAPAAGSQKLTITPSRGLAARQSVQLSGSGFSPHEALVVTECATKGNATGPGDCNLAGILSVTSDAAGAVAAAFTVVKGPFGFNQIVCGPQQACLVSVSQAVANPTQEADAAISFG
jgi:hypothetical protein